MRHPDLQVLGSCSLHNLAPGPPLGYLNSGMEILKLCLESFQSHHTVGWSFLGTPEGPCLFSLLGHVPLQMQTPGALGFMLGRDGATFGRVNSQVLFRLKNSMLGPFVFVVDQERESMEVCPFLL